MKRLALLVSLAILLGGCAELKVISGAALNELQADAIAVNVGREINIELPKKPGEKAILLAMVEKRETAWEEKRRTGKKGLWEQSQQFTR